MKNQQQQLKQTANQPSTDLWAQKLHSLGTYFGYPSCCIDEFIAYALDSDNLNRPTRPRRQFHGTGYVPCAACDTKSRDALLETIAKNRKHSRPFPDDSGFYK
jgi:hypothetical protein